MESDKKKPTSTKAGSNGSGTLLPSADAKEIPSVEIGGPKGPEPTRYGDWEQKGRCTDF